MLETTEDVQSRLERELRRAQRHQRFLSVVMGTHDRRECSFADLFSNVLRDSDEVIEDGLCATILMEETDEHGALAAVKRLTEEYGYEVDLRLGAASYPKDGQSAAALLAMARSRLDSAERKPPDARDGRPVRAVRGRE